VSERQNGRILIVDTNPLFLERLAQDLRASGYEAVTANTGEQAFLLLRDWQHPVDWLYTRAALPVMIDGWILADEYHDTHPDRAVVLAASLPRASTQGNVVLGEPTPAAVVQTIRNVIGDAERSRDVIDAASVEHRFAA